MPATTHKFCLRKAALADFKPSGGLRDWLDNRDLGLNDATDGEYDAWISRANGVKGGTGRHYHNYDFQVMYVLSGWLRMYHEGEGEVVMEEGDFVYHPKGHVHEIIEYSDDLELFELASPAGRHSIDI